MLFYQKANQLHAQNNEQEKIFQKQNYFSSESSECQLPCKSYEKFRQDDSSNQNNQPERILEQLRLPYFLKEFDLKKKDIQCAKTEALTSYLSEEESCSGQHQELNVSESDDDENDFGQNYYDLEQFNREQGFDVEHVHSFGEAVPISMEQEENQQLIDAKVQRSFRDLIKQQQNQQIEGAKYSVNSPNQSYGRIRVFGQSSSFSNSGSCKDFDEFECDNLCSIPDEYQE
ncbi:hypothetical protein FGO68_gene3183 [Halteria grandinella]|uniref:Uncharacterized protein n=1 Tax=Halteria grandinella TaxID=5974 RepID=A0A8J8NNJ1_HALGN|nr:hypothetical protein FGO68_gene3183 [Halteria grandinella]